VTALAGADFDAFFGALWRARDGGPLAPFPWQRRLVRRILGEDGGHPGWPRFLALPTASGKTAAIDVAVFTLACQADAPSGARTAPRRIFFVVDRRVIVDEAFERARTLAAKLAAADGGVLGRVADRLRELAGGADDVRPLEVFELRGGIYRDDAWARTPLQPTVIASTVDQVGSRLLHRGYGVSWRSWPIHAGLAGHDALVILDEAHCSRPFHETLDAVARYRDWAVESPPAPFARVAMTATPRPGVPGDEVFRLDDEDRGNPELGRRLRASKPARLLPPVPGKSGSSRLIQLLCKEAEKAASGGARRIAILVNRVATARRAFEELDDRAGEKVLMVGRMRPWDRDRLIERWRPYLAADPERKAHERPIFVVATQCLEVGANLDFDAMVTECASLDALRQRFGRLNRLGEDARARAAVAVAADDLKGDATDFVYGTALQATWSWLATEAGAAAEGDPALDFGIDALDARGREARDRDPELADRLAPPAPEPPVMLPAHLDQWVQTAPAPAADPDVAVFLHGSESGAPEVLVCWRRDLEIPPEEPQDREELRALWTDTVAQLPPSAAECMPVPLHVVQRWLRGEPDPAANLTDVEGSAAIADDEAARQAEPEVRRRIVLRWRGPEDSEIAGPDRPPRPGDTLVIPAALGGWEVFGHIPPEHDGRLPIDLGEAAHFVRRRRAVLRLHPAVLAGWPDGTARARTVELASWDEATAEEKDLDGAAEAFLRDVTDDESVPEELRQVVLALCEHGFDAVRHPSERGWLLRGKCRVPLDGERERAHIESEVFTSDDDSASVTTDASEVTLTDHCAGVVEFAERFADGCGLSPALAGDVALAARLHDVGKADPRFQAWLQGGNALAAQLAPRLLAKSRRLPGDRRQRERARRRAGYPPGNRHELLSVRLVESAPSLLERASDADLVLHLIASHHGHCRPFAPVIADDEPVDVRLDEGGRPLAASSATGLEAIDSGVAERFWRLVRRYGWWGLALLEAILRLSDHRCSEAEEAAAQNRRAGAGRKTA
jgi:CRISPR-associated endonuclease/helicase Cas3